MALTYYIKLFHMGADRHNGILMSLLLLVKETKIERQFFTSCYPNFEQILTLYSQPNQTSKMKSFAKRLYSVYYTLDAGLGFESAFEI